MAESGETEHDRREIAQSLLEVTAIVVELMHVLVVKRVVPIEVAADLAERIMLPVSRETKHAGSRYDFVSEELIQLDKTLSRLGLE